MNKYNNIAAKPIPSAKNRQKHQFKTKKQTK